MKGVSRRARRRASGVTESDPKTEIENRHREVVGVSAHHCLVKSMADADDNRAHPGERVLDIHREQKIVFDQEHCDAAQWMIIVY